jgi:hypothetical protein
MTDTTDRPEVDDPRVLALAKARQQLAYENPFNAVCPPWDGLSEQEQHLSLLDARSYLHAALRAGLVPASAVVPAADRAFVLTQAERDTLTHALNLAEEEILSLGEGDVETVDSLRRLAVESAVVDRVAAETPPAETQRCTCGGRFPLQHLHADTHGPAVEAQPGKDTETPHPKEA